jgi:predicted Zn-dependent protease
MGQLTTTAVSVEQLRALAEKIREAKAGAVTEMKVAIQAMHEQGTLLVQAEMELGAAFDGWVDGLADHGIDPMAARYSMKVAKKHKDIKSLFSNPSAAKQMVLQNFAPSVPPKAEARGRGAWRLTRSV